MMTKRVLTAGLVLWMTGCQRSDVKVLIGATAVVNPGAPPIEDAVIVIAGKRVRSVGMRKDVPIPQDSERSDLTGKWVTPASGGRIEPGARADLVVLDHPPPSEAGAARRMVDGEWQAAR